MSKELEMVRTMINGANEYEKKTGDKNPPVYFSKNNLLIIETALQRLEAIDNANPSEALECLEKLKGMEISSMPFSDEYGTQEVDLNDIRKVGSQLNTDFREYTATIKQALLKIQEPKHYLKWEDLEKDRTYKVLLNGNQYELVKRYDDYEYRCDYITLQKKPNVSIFIYEYEKEIFNDLHLERVEEK